MRHLLIAAALAVLLPLAAEAAEITVFAPGVTTAGIRKLANAWTIETGNRVNIIGGTIGAVKGDVTSGMPGDIAMLPPEDLKDKEVAAKLQPGTTVPVGRILFGLIVKAGAPHPDISTVKKFAAALKAASGVGFNDPATQSLGGQMVAAMLTKPEFKGVIGVPLKQGAAGGVADGTVPMAGGTRSEQLGNPSIELVGLFPESLKMHLDMSAAVLADTKLPAAAAQFAHYIVRAEAAAAWNDCGVVAPTLKGQPAMGSCYDPLPTMALPPSADEARAPRPARARGIPAVLAIEGAQTAIATCLITNFKVTALVVDAAGIPITMISGDGAAAVTQRIAMGKAQTVIKYKMTSGAVTARANSDPAFMAQLAADPLVGPPRQGAIPIMVGGEMVGAFAVSGAPGGDRDEPCAIAGLARIQNRLQ
jgi:molybdate transport system substrate-binding protein